MLGSGGRGFGFSAINFSLSLIMVFGLILPLWGRIEGGRSLSGSGPGLMQLDEEYHDVNAVILMVDNNGPIGINTEESTGWGFFPAGTSNNYVYGTGLWFGAYYDANGDGSRDPSTEKVFIHGYNPLAGDSEFREGNNEQDPDDPLTRIFKSDEPSDLVEWPQAFHEVVTTRVDTVIYVDPREGDQDTAFYTVPDTYGDPLVRSDQDFVTTYTTKDKSLIFGTYSMPLEVNQRSMAYRSGLAAQAIYLIFDVRNWGEDVLTDAWVGYDNDMDVGVSYGDDLTSFIRNRDMVETPESGDSARVNMAYAWDSDFTENNFTGDPGFVGIAYLRSPGNPFDGIDNDGDGLTDESTSNGLDDDGDGKVDDPFEVDELGLVNFSKHCSPSVPCPVNDPEDDPSGYGILACNTEFSYHNCYESTEPADVRFMMSSGPFDWLPGQTQQVVLAMVFANAVGNPSQLEFVGNPPRPDANDPAFGELLAVKEVVQGVFDLGFPEAEPPSSAFLTLIPGDGKVTILWNDLPVLAPDPNYEEFVLLDPEYREFDFEGFRVWRSRTGSFSRLGDINDPDFPLTPEAILENELVEEYDLTLLAQYDLANGITRESQGVTCKDSLVLQNGSVVYTECDTFNLGTDTGLQYSYVDDGDPGDPLINGMRYYYCVTSYDYNSDNLPVSRLSMDSGVSFPGSNSVIPYRRTDELEVSSDVLHVDPSGNALDDTSSIFVSSETGELDPPEAVHASNSLTGFSFTTGTPEDISSDWYTVIFDAFERLDASANRVSYHVEDASGQAVNDGTANAFDLPYDGTDQSLGLVVFDPEDESTVLFTSVLTFNVDESAFVLPDRDTHLSAVNGSGADMSDSLGNVSIPAGSFIAAGFRAADIEMEWMAVAGDTLTLEVRDLDNRVDVPFGEGIVSGGQVVDAEKGSNWSFLPLAGGGIQPGGRYFLTAAVQRLADLWVSGVRITTTNMPRMPQAGDVWTLRQVAMTTETEVDTTVTPPDTITTYFDAKRPPVPGTRYRLDTTPAQDLTPPDFTIGIFQNTILTNDLDLYIVASEEMDTVPELTVGGSDVPLSEMASEEVELYSASYRLEQSGTYIVTVSGFDTWGNEGEGSEEFSAGQVWRASGGVLLSSDRVLKLIVPPDAIREDSKFFMCIAEGDLVGGTDPSRDTIARLGGDARSVASPPVMHPVRHSPNNPESVIRLVDPYLDARPDPNRAVATRRGVRSDDPIVRRGLNATRPPMGVEKQGLREGANLTSDPGVVVSPIYSLSPPGERLYRPAELSFDLSQLRMSDVEFEGLGIYLWTEDGWLELDTYLDPSSDRITTSVDLLGSYQLRTASAVTLPGLPKAFSLSQNYPNPFNPSTTIGFDIPEGSGEVWTELIVYNIRGQRVKTLLKENKAPGSYFVQWDGRSDTGQRVSSGIYLYRLKAGDYVSTRKMVTIK